MLLERIALLPKKLTKVASENGRVILAHGSATGHSHSIDAADAEMFLAPDGTHYLRVTSRPIKTTLRLQGEGGGRLLVKSQKLGPIQFAEGDIEVVAGVAKINGVFALLQHDEHSAQALPVGDYLISRQSEFDPQEVRRVQD